MIVDDTLREGLQAPGISYTMEEKLSLARIISSCGIKKALVSYPSAHFSESEITKKIVSEKIFDEVFALGRTLKQDIDAIYETGANISLHLPFRLENMDKVMEAIRYAATKDRILEVSVVDVMKNSPGEIIKLAKKVEESGADIIQLPDTTGIGTPQKIGKLFSMARNEIKCEIDTHCHNDNGLSVANAIAAIENGADRIDTSLYGIGERNGITDTASISKFMELNGIDTGINQENMKKAYGKVLELILKKTGPDFFQNNFPVNGINVSTNTAGTHVAYSDVFTAKHMSFNVYAGKTMVNSVLKNKGIHVDETILRKILEMVKDMAVETGMCITPSQIVKMAGELPA